MTVEPFELKGKTIQFCYQEPCETTFDHSGVQGMQIRLQFTDGTDVVIKQEMNEYFIGHGNKDDDRNWFVACNGLTEIHTE